MNDCLFCKIAAGEIPSNKLYEDDRLLAFYDIDPKAPTHFLVIPKEHIGGAGEITPENSSVVAYAFETIARLAKELGPNGNYRYKAPTTPERDDFSPRLKTVFRESLISYALAQNIVVIKTPPGLAPACCSALDSMEIDGLVGTIAGDDTAFIAIAGVQAHYLMSHPDVMNELGTPEQLKYYREFVRQHAGQN